MLNLVFQVLRFVGIGFLNTAVDFAVINFLAAYLGIYKGGGVAAINVISFTVAVLHSFYWNKYWAFSGEADTRVVKNLGKFVLAAGLGVLILAFVGFGSSKEFSSSYYLILISLLAVGEIILWKLFRLGFVAGALSQSKKELGIFVAVSLVGAAINSGIITIITSSVEPLFGLNRELWLNLAKALATGVSLVWNFIGYKILVFKK